MKTRKLKDHRYANTHVEISENADRILLYSYNTLILECTECDEGSAEYNIRCTGLYSMTTIRHIGWFMREYFKDKNYHDVKKLYHDSQELRATLNDKIKRKIGEKDGQQND